MRSAGRTAAAGLTPPDRLLPTRSPGVLAVELAGHGVLFDPLTERAHVLNRTGLAVWSRCDGTTTVDAFAAELGHASATDATVVCRDVDAYLAHLRSETLVGRTQPPVATRAAPTTPDRAVRSRSFAVAGRATALTSDDSGLVTAIDALLAPMATDGEPTVVLAADVGPDRTVALRDPVAVRHGSVLGFLEALPSHLNQVAASSPTSLTFHAGAVRGPRGVAVLPATSGSGKTTLVAALVQAGFAYLTDEAVGVRDGSLDALPYPKPLVLDATSRAVLGLAPTASQNVSPLELAPEVEVVAREAGPVTACVLPRHQVGAETLVEELDGIDAFLALLEHALNVRIAGQAALDALAQLAERVPCRRITYSRLEDATALVAELIA